MAATGPVFVDVHDDRPEPDWNQLADAGVVGVYLKLGEGRSSIGGFESPARGVRARAAGLLVGFYWFARPDLGHQPGEEAIAFSKVLSPVQHPSDWRPCLDLERGVPRGFDESVGAWGRDVLHVLQLAHRPRVAWYSSLSQATAMPELWAWPAWVAAFGPNDGTDHGLTVPAHMTVLAHQYTSNARFAGYQGDASRFLTGRVARMLAQR